MKSIPPGSAIYNLEYVVNLPAEGDLQALSRLQGHGVTLRQPMHSAKSRLMVIPGGDIGY